MSRTADARRRIVPVIGRRLRRVLVVVMTLFALLAVNSLYLAAVTLGQWSTGALLEGLTYQWMFVFHLAVGLLLIVPLLVFIAVHAARAWSRPNRRAVWAGLGLLACVLVLLASGLALVRFEGFELKNPQWRDVVWWAHVLSPLLAAWLFVLHRLVGPRLRWKVGFRLAAAGLVFAALIVGLEAAERHRPAPVDLAEFAPALIKTATGGRIAAQRLMMDDYCAGCHADVHQQWQSSAHRFASFNNPVYAFSVNNTRAFLLERDGNVHAARFCAACHDPVPLLSGAFDDPEFNVDSGPQAQAGITCTVCHAVSSVDSPRGNADFTITEPVHYPFTFARQPWLRWLNRQLIKANPGLHKATYLKPLHKRPEFCGSCHKVAIPEALNGYKWLRGQNHYDSFLQSGVSGHGVSSFYYPPVAQANCAGCHMPLTVSDDFGARANDESGALTVHDHLFPAANTALAALLDLGPEVIEAHQQFLAGALRVDVVALRADGRTDGELIGPIRPTVPPLAPGRSYLLEVVLRTLKLGHAFTQGTTDSNEVWVQVEVFDGGRRSGHSGGLDPDTGAVDPWSHFVNVYMLDREGRRIDRRNVEDIFTPLYNHQIPPGAADVVHYRLDVPEAASGPIEVRVRLLYRKFDAVLMAHVRNDPQLFNDLPVTVIAEDRVHFPVRGSAAEAPAPGVPEWVRWNDYGIALLRKPARRQLRQAEEAFGRVEALGEGAGALNLARVYLEEGRLDEARDALTRARSHPRPPPPWSLAWFTGRVLFEQGEFEAAIRQLDALAATRFAEARERGFDFSRDLRLNNQLGLSWLELALGRDGADRAIALSQAQHWFEQALAVDPENVEAHYNLARLHRAAGRLADAERHARAHARYRPDDNARDRAIAAARRRDPAADHLADPVVILDLHRPGRERYPLAVPVAARPTSPEADR